MTVNDPSPAVAAGDPSPIPALARRALPLLALAAVVVTALAVTDVLHPVDEAWAELMTAMRGPVPTRMARLLDVVGDTAGVTVTVVVGGLLLALAGHLRVALAWAALVSSAALVSTVTKLAVGRARPDGGLVDVLTPSYPSGHVLNGGAATAIGLAVLCAVVWPRSVRWAVPLAVGWTALMAWSRTYLLVHWLSDTLGGVVLGTTVVAVAVALVGDHLRPDPAGPGADP